MCTRCVEVLAQETCGAPALAALDEVEQLQVLPALADEMRTIHVGAILEQTPHRVEAFECVDHVAVAREAHDRLVKV